jgi:hypothetical protein
MRAPNWLPRLRARALRRVALMLLMLAEWLHGLAGRMRITGTQWLVRSYPAAPPE